MFDYYSKKNIFLPQKMLNALKQDALRFEVFGQGEKLVMNRFLTHLLVGYYSKYSAERREQADIIRKQLQSEIRTADKLNEITTILLDTFSPRSQEYDSKETKVRISYKPTKETYDIIYEIEHTYDGVSASLSQYLRTMFASYLAHPIYEREKIIFKETAEILEKACQKQQTITLRSITSPDKFYRVIPYQLVHTSEEMFNYLLCQGYNEQTGQDIPFTMRLCRIQNPRIISDPDTLKPEIQHLLDLMILRTPQYAIYKDEKTRVLLTKDGIKTYSRIYYGRPDPIMPPEELPDGKVILTFNHSRDQLYFYFRRFAANEAIVQEPKQLVEDIKAFHADAWKAYEEGRPYETVSNKN